MVPKYAPDLTAEEAQVVATVDLAKAMHDVAIAMHEMADAIREIKK